MEKLVASGKTRAIGVSNFNIPNLDRLLKNCKIIPAVNQVYNRNLLFKKHSALNLLLCIGRNASLFTSA